MEHEERKMKNTLAAFRCSSDTWHLCISGAEGGVRAAELFVSRPILHVEANQYAGTRNTSIPQFVSPTRHLITIISICTADKMAPSSRGSRRFAKNKNQRRRKAAKKAKEAASPRTESVPLYEKGGTVFAPVSKMKIRAVCTN